MSDTNWCTFCDNAIHPDLDSLYCSEECLRQDALQHHPMLGYDFGELRGFLPTHRRPITSFNHHHHEDDNDSCSSSTSPSLSFASSSSSIGPQSWRSSFSTMEDDRPREQDKRQDVSSNTYYLRLLTQPLA